MKTLIKKIALACLFLLTASVASAYVFEYEGCYYDIISSTDRTCEITYEKLFEETEVYKGDFVIPETVKYGNNIYKVVGIGSSAFRNCSNLTGITIPKSITFIGSSAFNSCLSLTSITIPESVTLIKGGAFFGCSSLTNITIPKSITSIENDVFYGCSSLTNITIPESVTSIGSGAFSGCSSLTSITIPESVASIEDNTFVNCSSLTNITIPESVTSIGSRAFLSCSSLANITIPESVTSIGSEAFWSCQSLTSITIPQSVTSIEYGTFSDCKKLENINIPESVTSIGYCAFFNCSNLTSINIPKSITSIENDVFYGCSSLTSIILPESLISIGSSAFSNCYSLTSITIPESVTSIGNDAFWGCRSLTSITIQGLITSIKERTFRNCSNLTCITIPESVTSIGSEAFLDCHRLESINMPKSVNFIGKRTFLNCSSLKNITIPESITSIEDSTFYSCFGLTNITIPESVTSIGSGAFSGCSNLRYINIPKSVTSIGDNAFRGCSSLRNINIPESVTSIGDNVFVWCQSLTSMTIPESIKSINAMIVAGCSNLQSFKINDGQDLIEIRNASVETNPVSNIFKELYIGRRLINNSNTSFINEDTGIEKVTFSQFATSVDDIGMDVAKDLKTVVSLGETPPTIADDFFSSDQYNNATLYIPQGAMQAYIEAPGWRYFYNVKELAYDFEYEGGYYNILSNKYLTCEITYKNKNRETEEYNGNFIIPETVKYDNDIYKVIGIGDGAFSYCSNLVGVTIPKSITSIGSGSFEGCSSLHEITVDDENSNFTSIKGVLYSKDITKIYCCPAKLTETTFTIPETVKSIEPYAFYGCANLTSITIPESVTFIGDYAFARCTSLTNITIPTSVQSISAMIVDECNNLQSFKIDDGLALIDINVSNENKDSTPLNMFKELYIGRYLLNNSFKPFINKNTGLEKVTFGSSAFFVYYIGMDLADDLKTVISYGSVPPVIDDDFFSAYQYNNATLNIPEGTLQEYKEATGWRNFYNIVESLPTGISNVESTSGMTITADNGNIVISNAHGQVNVYDVSGVLINSAIADGTDLRITVPDHGIYIVKAGGKTQKVTM